LPTQDRLKKLEDATTVTGMEKKVRVTQDRLKAKLHTNKKEIEDMLNASKHALVGSLNATIEVNSS